MYFIVDLKSFYNSEIDNFLYLFQAIVFRDIKWPNGLTIDFVLRKVYWADSKLNSISWCKFDGSDRRVSKYI